MTNLSPAFYVLEHYNIVDFEKSRMFSNVDYAIDYMRTLLLVDRNLQNYSLSKYVLDENGKQYVPEKYYDLSELVNVREMYSAIGDLSDEEEDDISILDSDLEEEDDSYS